MNVLYEAIASLQRQVDERIADDATTPCLLSFDRARAVLDALLAYTAQPVKTYCGGKPNHCTPEVEIYKREWVGLTLDEKKGLNDALNLRGRFPVIDAIEAKLKEKNT